MHAYRQLGSPKPYQFEGQKKVCFQDDGVHYLYVTQVMYSLIRNPTNPFTFLNSGFAAKVSTRV